MGEILGLGMTHYPPLIGLTRTWPISSGRVLKDPGLPERYRDPASWPEAMRREYGDDGGTASAAGHRAEPRPPLPPRPQDPRRVPAGRRRHLGRRPARELHRGRDPAVLRPRLRPGRGAPLARATRRRPTSGASRPTPGLPHQRPSRGRQVPGAALLEQGVDMAYAYKPLHHQGLAHAFLNTVMYLDYDRVGFPYPVVAFQVNCYGRRVIAQRGGRGSLANPLADADLDPPSPSPKRCMEVGAATARAMRESPWRVGADRLVQLVARVPDRQAPPALSRHPEPTGALRGAPGRRLRDLAPARRWPPSRPRGSRRC